MSLIHFRLIHYSLTLCLYLYTVYDVVARLVVTTKDPVVADFAKLQGRSLIIWTFLLQIAYMILGLTADLLTINASKPDLAKRLSAVREVIFSSLLWPTSWTVTTMLWPMYLYDPAMVFPSYVHKVFSPFNNQVLQTYICSAAVFELACLGRREKNHWRNLGILTVYMALYMYVFTGSYLERGIWLYPIFDKLMGTVYFHLLIIATFVLLTCFYFLQFALTDYFWQTKKRGGKKKH